MSVVIHKKNYTSQEIDEKLILAHKERQFEFSSFVPTMLKGGVNYDDTVIDAIINEMIATNIFEKTKHSKKFRCDPTVIKLLQRYIFLVKTNTIPQHIPLELALRSNKNRSDSGVLVFTLLMSNKPFKIVDGVKKSQNFTCKHNCYYCPNEPNMSRSYISSEPAVRRGDSFNWDPVAQIYNRIKSYISTGQISAFTPSTIKGEFILEGGTYSAYPYEYREWFMQQIYYACNTVYDNNDCNNSKRSVKSLSEEMKINETCIGIRVIGMSIETRPDDINQDLCKELRTFGVTKVQIGVQHTNDIILEKVNRKCTTHQVKIAMRILLNNGFKIQIHLMPDLPGSNPQEDINMFEEIFSCEEFGFDHLKVYPTMIVNFTKIKEWYEAKEYVPYGDDNNEILKVLVEMTRLMIKYNRYDIRKERIIRDIPSHEIEGGTSDVGMGDTLLRECKKQKISCVCIRCREVKGNIVQEPVIVVRQRIMCGDRELFISFESPDQKMIYGFLRLRLPSINDDIFTNELNECSIIRELHVYGTAASVGVYNNVNVQNRGLGSRLVKEAERISIENGYKSICVISGNGVKEYYAKKHSFVDGEYYMKKNLF